ncbi:MAG: cytidylate kinase-like family protein [Dehalococcoidia bacterium]|nr:cytidylate kinase-like family protein [Dehalococcoidia bacterium]
MPVVTIRGKVGSGAPEVGREIARRLSVGYVDREIIAEVATRLQRQERDVIAKEMPPSGLRGRIAEALGHSFAMSGGFEGAYLPVLEMPLNDSRYLEALKSLILELAGGGSIVLYGRGSQFILKGRIPAFHVLTVAPQEMRLRRMMASLKLDQERAKREMARFDTGGREFVRRYFHTEWEDPLHYDMVINSKSLSFHAIASIVVNALGLKEAKNDDSSILP